MEERGEPAVPPQERAPNRPDRWRPRQSTALGGLLILVGAILLLREFVRVDVGHYGWPFFVIAPGVLFSPSGNVPFTSSDWLPLTSRTP